MLLLKKLSNAFAAIVCSRWMKFASNDSQDACVRIAAVVLAAAALSGTAEADITTLGDVSPTYPSDDPEPPDPWHPGDLLVGENGTGEIAITGGSIVRGSFASIGDKTTAIGTAFVTGVGSKWENSDARWVGNEGRGTLHIREGGFVTNSHARIGVTSTSDGTAFVTGAGSTWENSHELAVGFGGAGTLVISEGGLVTNNNHGRLGVLATGLGTVSVTGTGSSWLLAPTGGETGIFSQFDVGESGTGILNITNGGLVRVGLFDSVGPNPDIDIGSREGSYGTILVDDATLENYAHFRVGNAGTGFLFIQNGGQVSTADGVIGLYGIGTATVTGPESRWMIEGSLGRLVVGTFGTGLLEIADGGQVSSAFGNIGTNSNVKVTGSDSAWVDLVRLDMKQNGSLKIESQGRVASEQGHLFDESNVTVTGGGSTWNSSILLELRDKASLTIESQGRVVSSYGVLSDESRIELEPGSASTLQIGGAVPAIPGDIRSRVSIGPTGNLFSLRGGTVKTEELVLTSSQTGRGQLRGNGYVAGLASMRPDGTLAGIRNGGLITAEGDYLDPPDFFGGPRGKAQLWIEGNYVQEAGGTLELTVTEDNRIAPIPQADSRIIPIRIDGHAQLDGKLQVSHTGISNDGLSVGDRFHLMEWQSHSGRFNSFSGAVIEGRNDLFFGLLYGDDGLELAAMSTPVRPDRQFMQAGDVTSNLAIICPGLPGYAQNDHVRDAGILQQNAEGEWIVVAANLASYGQPEWQTLLDLVDGDLDQTRETLRVFHQIGDSTAFWMAEMGLLPAETIHVFTPSAGIWWADGLSDRLASLEAMGKFAGNVHLTFADATLVHATDDPRNIGDTADFVEQYFDRGSQAAGTYTILPNAINIDVTNMRRPLELTAEQLKAGTPFTIVGNIFLPAAHAHPYVYWLDTMKRPDELKASQIGFRLSKESGANGIPTYGTFNLDDHQFPKGGWYASGVTSDGKVFIGEFRPSDLGQVHLENVVVSETGDITVSEGEVTFETGSPAMLTAAINLPATASLLSFDYSFLTEVNGLFSVYFDGQQIFAAENSWHEIAGDVFTSGLLLLPIEDDTTLHTLLFRLDPLEDTPAKARITNLRFHSVSIENFIFVPEPTSLTLVFLGLLLSIRFNRHSR